MYSLFLVADGAEHFLMRSSSPEICTCNRLGLERYMRQMGVPDIVDARAAYFVVNVVTPQGPVEYARRPFGGVGSRGWRVNRALKTD